ncbi:uncharacterized protein METZ01_LOCUS510578, partial [marine metagenome]
MAIQTHSEKFYQLGHVRLAGAQAEMIDVHPTKLFFQLLLSRGAVMVKVGQLFFTAQIDFSYFTRFCILQCHAAQGGQLFLVRINDLDGHHVVPAV